MEYKAQTERLRLLGRQSAPAKATQNGLALEISTRVQAEFNRPFATVNALVQKHYGLPHETTQGQEEPVASPSSSRCPSAEYTRRAQQRAAAAAAARRAERESGYEKARATKVRLDLAKEFSMKVAVGNARVLLGSPPRLVSPRAVPAAGVSSPRQTVSSGAVVAAAVPLLKQLSVFDQLALERRPEVLAAVAGLAAPKPAAPLVRASAEPQRDAAAAGNSAEDELPPPAGPGLAELARRRLLAYRMGRQDDSDAKEAIAAVPHAAAKAEPSLGTLPGYPREPRRAALQARVLQPVENVTPTPIIGKPYKGRLLPLAASARDAVGLSRIAAKVKEQDTVLPRLCPCQDPAAIFDVAYTAKCCKNCPLYGRPERYERLLTFVLRNAGVI